MISQDQKKQMLIDAVDYYIYSMQKVNANQSAINVYTELLNQLEDDYSENVKLNTLK
jgi:hypothetical protein